MLLKRSFSWHLIHVSSVGHGAREAGGDGRSVCFAVSSTDADWSCSGHQLLFFILDPEWGGPSM